MPLFARCRTRRAAPAALAACTAFVLGCSSTPEKKAAVPSALQNQASAFAASVPVPELHPLFTRLYVEGERNATLNYQRIGLAALALGKLDIAEPAFDAATLRIGQIYADNPQAQKAKSLWAAESVKDYKGEPYERAMAYFYRGLIYAARNDFQNARAMFKQAEYQDTVAEAEEFAGDFALMPYMAGWASYCDGDSGLAQDYYQSAVKSDPAYASVSVEQPVLVLLETGRAPAKYRAGEHGEMLKWQPYKLPAYSVTSACAADGGQCLDGSFVLGADIGYQATTRGGRPIDAILGGKASFKEGAQTTSTVAAAVGSAFLVQSMSDVAVGKATENVPYLGSILSLFASSAAKKVAEAVETQADIREWEQLPGTIWLAAANARAQTPQLLAQVQQKTAADTPQQSAVPLTRLVDSPTCQLYWSPNRSPVRMGALAPGPLEPGTHPQDAAFRAQLRTSFLSGQGSGK